MERQMVEAGCWIELSRASASRRMPVDLRQTRLVEALVRYVAENPVRRTSTYTDLCYTHYQSDDSSLKSGIRYKEIIIDLDYDSGSNRTENFQAAADAARKLIALFDEHSVPYRVYFSGSKGFHLTVPGKAFWPVDPQTQKLSFIPQANLVLRRMIRALCAAADVPESVRSKKGNAGWDPSLYDLRRMVRIPGMPHGKSLIVSQEVLGRPATIFKSWLPAEWTGWSMKEIVEWSTERRPLPAWGELNRNSFLEGLWDQACIANDAEEGDKPVIYKPATLRKIDPTTVHQTGDVEGYPPCIQSIRQRVIDTLGLRNTIGIAVCSFHASAGGSLEDAIQTMRCVPSRSSNLVAETRSQWAAITTKDGKPKENYRFSNRSCRTLRSLGATCTDQCPLYAEFSKNQQTSKRSVPVVRPYDWGTVDVVRLENL